MKKKRKNQLLKLDAIRRYDDQKLNPGTTADLAVTFGDSPLRGIQTITNTN